MSAHDRVHLADDGSANYPGNQPLLGIMSSTWPTAIAFTEAMIRKLEVNAETKGPDGQWAEDDVADLLHRVKQETNELVGLHAAILRDGFTSKARTVTSVIEEAADIANMAMMAADAFCQQVLGIPLHEFVQRGNR